MRQMPMKRSTKNILKKLGHGWQLKRFRKVSLSMRCVKFRFFERVISFYANLIQFDHPGWVKDASNQTSNAISVLKMIHLLVGQ